MNGEIAETVNGPLFYGSYDRQALVGTDPSYPDKRIDLTYIWFPDDMEDVAIVRTKEAFGGTPIPLMGAVSSDGGTPEPMPRRNNISSLHGRDVHVVGYSSKTFPSAGRRYAHGKVFMPITEAGTSQDMAINPNDKKYVVKLDSGKAICKGDSGGPILFFDGSNNFLVGGVVLGSSYQFEGTDGCVTVPDFWASYISRTFVNRLCKDADGGTRLWENCSNPSVPITDQDQDGKDDITDICKDNPNASQRNTNAAWDPILHTSILPDACDPKPSVTMSTPPFTPIHETLNAKSSLINIDTILCSKVSVHYRPIGYEVYRDASILYYDPGDKSRTHNLIARYCACHYKTSTAMNPMPILDAVCKSSYCPHADPMPTVNVFDDTGYQKMLWEGCKLTNTDTTKDYNECTSDIQDITFHRLYGGTVYCTDYDELGCRINDDNNRFWRLPGMTGKFVWDWRRQDYPHTDTAGHYDHSQTTQATVRMWLRPDYFPVAMASGINSAFTEPHKLIYTIGGTLNKLLYEPPRLRWLIPAFIDPAVPSASIRILAPVHRDTTVEECPESMDWNVDWQSSSSATRGVVTSLIRLVDGGTNQASGCLIVDSDNGQAIHTVGFSAVQHEEGILLFGGANRYGALSNEMWFGGPSGPNGDLAFEKIAGGSMQSAVGTSTATMKTLTSLFQSWKKKISTTKSRSALKTVISSSLKLWTKRQPKSVGSKTLSAPSFSQGAPIGQAESILAYSPGWATATVFFGDTGASPSHGSLVDLAIYDVLNAAWTVGTVDWSETSGARRHAMAAMIGEEELVFYGGEANGTAYNGLYRVDLSPEQLLSGLPPLRLDDQSSSNPGPRTYAALGYDPISGTQGKIFLVGGINGSGQRLNDLWEFSFDSGQWTQLSDGTEQDAPHPMVAAGIFISYLNGSVVVYSGTAASGGGDNWAYRFTVGQGWEKLEHSVTSLVRYISTLGSPAVTGCFEEKVSGDLEAATCSDQPEQGFELRFIEGDLGQFEIVRISDGQCLRLDGTILTRTVGDLQCQYIDWLTPLAVGACGDERARFDIIAWTGDAGYRVRQRFPCFLNNQPAGYDVGSCVDTNASGNQKLRIAQCVEEDRQRLLAPGWPELE